MPLELWYSVFEYAASEVEAQRAAFATEHNVPNIHYTSLVPLTSDLLREELDSPTCFPYAVSSTCRFFRRLAVATPSAWRRIRVFLEGQDPASTLRKYLDWPERKALSPTDILITRKNWTALLSALAQSDQQASWDDDQEPLVNVDEEEDRKVRELMGVLLPNVTQATSLVIQTIDGASLPSIFHFNSPSCPNLHTLVLDSVTRGRRTPIPVSDDLGDQALHTVLLPAVQTLTLTGSNFVSLWRSVTWREWYSVQHRDLPRFSKLRISHCRGADGKPTTAHGEFTPLDFFSAFFTGCLGAGELFDVSCEEWDLDDECMAPLDLEFTTMEKVSTPAIKTYLKCAHPFITQAQDFGVVHTFIGCDIGPTDEWSEVDAMIFGYSIHISRIANPETLRTYLDLTANDVFNLYVVSDCPGFDDSVVGHLPSGASPGRRPVPDLRALYVSNCPHISLQALTDVAFELNDGRIEEADEDTDESSSEYKGLENEFYDEVLKNNLDDFLNSDIHDNYDDSDQRAIGWSESSEHEDESEDGDYVLPDLSSDNSVGDLDSVSL